MQETSLPDPLMDDFAAIEALASAPAVTAAELAGNLARIYDLLFNADLTRYDPAAARQSAAALVERVFLVRLRLRDQVADWLARGFMTTEVQNSLRDVFRVARYGLDMLGEIAAGHPRLKEGEHTRRAFTGSGLDTQVNPRFAGAPLAFQSGDVFLVRGMIHNSAAIARIGDVDSMFSHVSMLYVDKDRKEWAVESLIEDGGVISPFDTVLDHGLGRAVVFRHKDAALAHRAAELMHERIVRSRARGGKRILYDFTMEPEGDGDLFCSKVIRIAYEEASQGRVKLPTFPTRLATGNDDFLAGIGVTAKTTFAPGDLELEPVFDLVADWQDFRVTSNLRIQDMVLTKMFEWMEKDGYKFRETFSIWLISVLGRLSSHLPESWKKAMEHIVPRVPINMSRRAVATIAMLHKTAEPLYRTLQKIEADTIRETGRSMHPRDILAALERIRAAAHGRKIGYLVPPR